MNTKLTLKLNKYQLALLEMHASNTVDQIWERKQQGSFDDQTDLEEQANVLLEYGTIDLEEALSWAEDLSNKLQALLQMGTEQFQQVELELTAEQISLLRNCVLYAADNLKDMRGSEWDVMTPDEDKLKNYGTTDYRKAMALIGIIDKQLPDDPLFGVPVSVLEQTIDRLGCLAKAMQSLVEKHGIDDPDMLGCLRQGKAAVQMLKNITTREVEEDDYEGD